MFIITNAAWGDVVEVTVEDVRKQAEIFGIDPEEITETASGIYHGNELIAEKR